MTLLALHRAYDVGRERVVLRASQMAANVYRRAALRARDPRDSAALDETRLTLGVGRYVPRSCRFRFEGETTG
jgi:hypothetical protein